MTARPLEQTAPFHLLARRTGNSTWWRSLTELALFIVVFALLFVAVTEGLRAGLGARADDLLAFGSMGVALLALPLAVRWGGRRPAVQLMGVVPRFDWPVFWRAASLTAGVMTLLILGVALLVGSRPAPAQTGVAVLAAAAFTIPLGALAEELICRAWLPQLLGRWVTSPVLAYGLVVPLFALVHNPGSIVEWANHLISGTCFAILAWASQGLAVPTAVHAASNLVLAAASQVDTTLHDTHTAAVVAAKSAALVLTTLVLVRQFRRPVGGGKAAGRN